MYLEKGYSVNLSQHTSHRPWPLPREPWIMFQRWHDLLFMHWRVPVEVLRPFISAQLTLETFDGSAWIAVVPFRMSHVRPRGIPSIPWLSAFPELNVRTYVSYQGDKPGVFFFSLDAANPLAVWGARNFYYLPYFNADMACEPGDSIQYHSRRTHRGAPEAELSAEYAPTADAYIAPPGSLEDWLTSRYCLYTINRRGEVLRGDIHHLPWNLQPASATIVINTMCSTLSLELPADDALLHFSARLDVLIWRLVRA